MKTLQDNILLMCEKSRTVVDLMNDIRPIIHQVLSTDEQLLSVDKTWCYYGTWTIAVWANEYHFGKELANCLKSIRKITHDEDKVFTINDLQDEIIDAIETFAYDNFS